MVKGFRRYPVRSDGSGATPRVVGQGYEIGLVGMECLLNPTHIVTFWEGVVGIESDRSGIRCLLAV